MVGLRTPFEPGNFLSFYLSRRLFDPHFSYFSFFLLAASILES